MATTAREAGAEAPRGSARYRRVLLKISGEALMGAQDYGLDPEMMDRIAQEIQAVIDLDVEVSVVIGGGNFFRGVSGPATGMERATADYMGMPAPVLNALALQSAGESGERHTRRRSALPLAAV